MDLFPCPVSRKFIGSQEKIYPSTWNPPLVSHGDSTGYGLRARDTGHGTRDTAGSACKKAGDTHPNHIGGGTVARAYGAGALIAFSRGPSPAQDEDLDEDQRR